MTTSALTHEELELRVDRFVPRPARLCVFLNEGERETYWRLRDTEDWQRVDLAQLTHEIPLGRRQALARGPMLPGEQTQHEGDRDEGCRVCEALVDLEWRTPHRQHRAAAALLDYHGAEGAYGEAAYERCVAIYRAAGWTGEYDARDLHGFEGDDG